MVLTVREIYKYMKAIHTRINPNNDYLFLLDELLPMGTTTLYNRVLLQMMSNGVGKRTAQQIIKRMWVLPGLVERSYKFQTLKRIA